MDDKHTIRSKFRGVTSVSIGSIIACKINNTVNMASLKEIVIMYQSLKREWDKKPTNLDRCGELLTKLKVKVPNGLGFIYS